MAEEWAAGRKPWETKFNGLDETLEILKFEGSRFHLGKCVTNSVLFQSEELSMKLYQNQELRKQQTIST